MGPAAIIQRLLLSCPEVLSPFLFLPSLFTLVRSTTMSERRRRAARGSRAGDRVSGQEQPELRALEPRSARFSPREQRRRTSARLQVPASLATSSAWWRAGSVGEGGRFFLYIKFFYRPKFLPNFFSFDFDAIFLFYKHFFRMQNFFTIFFF